MKTLRILLLLISATAFAQQAPIRTIGGAYTSVKTSNVCVSNVLQALMPTTALAGRVSVVITNTNANTIYCSESQAVVALGSAGTVGQPVPQNSTQTWAVGPTTVIYCISATAAQTTGTGCASVTEGAP